MKYAGTAASATTVGTLISVIAKVCAKTILFNIASGGMELWPVFCGQESSGYRFKTSYNYYYYYYYFTTMTTFHISHDTYSHFLYHVGFCE